MIMAAAAAASSRAALPLLLLALSLPAAQTSSGSACSDEMLASVRGGRQPADCDVCVGQHQPLLRGACCSAADVAAWCNGWAATGHHGLRLQGRTALAAHHHRRAQRLPCASGAASTRASMARAATLGFNVIRFGASGF